MHQRAARGQWLMEQVSLRDYCEQARSLIQSGEPDRAIHITRHILRHYPRHVESYRLLGQALLATDNYQEAARQFRRVLSADPEDVASRVGLARIYGATGDLDKAIWHIRRAVELSPGDSDFREQLGRLISASQAGDASEPVQITRVALGRIYARRRLHAKAIQEFKTALTRDQARTDVQAALAEVLWQAGHHLEAVEVCHRIRKKLPYALKANLIIGALCLDNHQPDEAEPYLALAQELDPENTVAQSLFGETSPLPPLTAKIEPLGEDEIESTQPKSPPTPLAEGAPVVHSLELAEVWMSELHEKGVTPMSNEERPDEEFELPEWLQGVGDDLLEEDDDRPEASIPESDSVESDETPDWLRNLVQRTEEFDESPPGEPGDVPDWLQELRPAVPEETSPDSDTPDWLASISSGYSPDESQFEPVPLEGGPVPLEGGPVPLEGGPVPGPAEAAQPEESDISGEPLVLPEAVGESAPGEDEGRALWEQILAEEEVDLESLEEVLPPEATGMTAEEWLRSTADVERAPSAAPEPAAEQPPLEEPEAPSVPVAETEVGEAGPPDWLKDLEEAEILPEPEAEEATTPTPLEEMHPSFLEPVSDIVEESDVPDWLREITAGEPVPVEQGPVPVEQGPVPSEEAEPVTAAAPTFPEADVDEAGLPDWLRDFDESAGEEEAEPQLEAPEVAGEPVATADEGRALWEQILTEEGVDLESLEEVLPPEATGMTAEEWLRSTADVERAPSAAPEPAAEQPPLEEPEAPSVPVAETEVGEAGPPDWLKETAEPVEEEIQPAAGVEVGGEEAPDWLREEEGPVPLEEGEPHPAEAGPVTPDTGAGLPDWLRELQEPPAEVEPLAEPVADEEPEEPVEAEVDEAGLPDWLREAFVETAELQKPEVSPPAEMPEWLTELETEDMLLAESDFEEPIELETGEMPEWLGEIMSGEPPLSEEWAAEPAEAETPEEEIPEWLRDFRAREGEVTAEPTAEAEEPEAPPEAEVLPEYAAQPELPDWLTRLREGVPEAEQPAPAEEYPVEAEAVPAEAPVEVVEAVPPEELLPEPEAVGPEEAGPAWLGELVRAEESLADFEAIEEEVVLAEVTPPTPEEQLELAEAEAPPAVPEPAEIPELAEAPMAERVTTRELKALRVEDLPKDPEARLSMAHAALNAGDWPEALAIYETLVNSSELLDSVIDNLEVGLRRHPDDTAGYQLLGDACMKDGRLHDALQAYRTALMRL
jgi:tetratricopeptide (TPR) repeat protein